MSQVESVPAGEWSSWVSENDATVLDVREADEWELGTLPGSKLLAMSEIVGKVGELDQQKATLVVCRSGNRSGQVAAYLAANGFERVANMTGGLKALGMQD
jgi:rhodanese-related sulfurtransferase